MANRRGYWSLETADVDGVSTDDQTMFTLSQADLDHIAELIKEGYTEGEIVADEEDE
jgi:hypothetical protein